MAADRATPWGLASRDEQRETTITHRDRSEQAQALERRERIKVALACLLYDDSPDDLFDALGITDDELSLARTVQRRLGQVTP